MAGFLGGVAGGASVSIIIKAIDQYSSELKKANNAVGSFSKSLTALKTIGVAAFTAIGAGLVAFGASAVQGALKLEEVSNAFRRLSSNSTQLLASLNSATGQTVANFDLIINANKALQLGLKENALPEIFNSAKRLGDAVGIDAVQAIDLLTDGLGKMNEKSLKNLNIMFDLQGAQKSYADSLGITVSELTEAQKAYVFNTAAIDAMRASVARLGPEQQSTADSIKQMIKAYGDFKDQIGAALLPSLQQLLTILMQNKETIISFAQAMVTAVGWLATALNAIVQTIYFLADGFGFLRTMLYAAKTTFNDVLSGVTPLSAALTEFEQITMRVTEGVKIDRDAKEQLTVTQNTLVESTKLATASIDPHIAKLGEETSALNQVAAAAQAATAAFAGSAAARSSKYTAANGFVAREGGGFAYDADLVNAREAAQGGKEGAQKLAELNARNARNKGRRRAMGGIVSSPETSMIGEAGPEAVIPLVNGSVPVRLVGGGGGATSVNVYIDSYQIAHRIEQQLVNAA